jgi:hypothetical protein
MAGEIRKGVFLTILRALPWPMTHRILQRIAPVNDCGAGCPSHPFVTRPPLGWGSVKLSESFSCPSSRPSQPAGCLERLL